MSGSILNSNHLRNQFYNSRRVTYDQVGSGLTISVVFCFASVSPLSVHVSPVFVQKIMLVEIKTAGVINRECWSSVAIVVSIVIAHTIIAHSVAAAIVVGTLASCLFLGLLKYIILNVKHIVLFFYK